MARRLANSDKDGTVLHMSAMLLVLCPVLGAVFASYAGVVAERGWKESATGRSECACGRNLTGKDLIPVFSWLTYGGLAPCCNSRIPSRYLFVELGAAATMLAAVSAFGVFGLVALFPTFLCSVAATRWLAS